MNRKKLRMKYAILFVATLVLVLTFGLGFKKEKPNQREVAESIEASQMTIQETSQDTIQEATQDTIQEATQGTIQDTIQEATQGTIQDTIQEATQETIQETIQEILQETGDGFHSNTFGVFLSAGPEAMSEIKSYQRVILDAQYFSKEEIQELHASGCTVYTYMNIGSLEDFRDYFSEYEELAMDSYENWEEEYWMDVTNENWEKLLFDRLVPEFLAKGVDGFFLDNVDVYYIYPEDEVYEQLIAMFLRLRETGKYILINSGNDFAYRYLSEHGNVDLFDGVAQETVFSSILWESDSFGVADPLNHSFFMEYVEDMKKAGKDIYLIEYTLDSSLIKDIKEYCKKHSFWFYISDRIDI